MPCFDLSTQVLIEQRRGGKILAATDEREIRFAGELDRREDAAESAADNNNSGLRFRMHAFFVHTHVPQVVCPEFVCGLRPPIATQVIAFLHLRSYRVLP